MKSLKSVSTKLKLTNLEWAFILFDSLISQNFEVKWKKSVSDKYTVLGSWNTIQEANKNSITFCFYRILFIFCINHLEIHYDLIEPKHIQFWKISKIKHKRNSLSKKFQHNLLQAFSSFSYIYGANIKLSQTTCHFICQRSVESRKSPNSDEKPEKTKITPGKWKKISI